MYDMNFFSVQKRDRSKNKVLKIFFFIFITVAILLNILLFGGRYYIFNSIESEIQSMRDYINHPSTKQAVEEAEKISSEAQLTSKYLNLLETIDKKMNQMDQINAELLINISNQTPEGVSYRSAQFSGINVSLTCVSSTATSPMDMYHALIESPLFDNVVMNGISIEEAGSSFSISFVVVQEGGEE